MGPTTAVSTAKYFLFYTGVITGRAIEIINGTKAAIYLNSNEIITVEQRFQNIHLESKNIKIIPDITVFLGVEKQ